MPHGKALTDNGQSDSGAIDYARYRHRARQLRALAFADAVRFILSKARLAAQPRNKARQPKPTRPGSQALDKRLPVG